MSYQHKETLAVPLQNCILSSQHEKSFYTNLPNGPSSRPSLWSSTAASVSPFCTQLFQESHTTFCGSILRPLNHCKVLWWCMGWRKESWCVVGNIVIQHSQKYQGVLQRLQCWNGRKVRKHRLKIKNTVSSIAGKFRYNFCWDIEKVSLREIKKKNMTSNLIPWKIWWTVVETVLMHVSVGWP